MFLAEPPPTAYDLHFRLLGIPVRITPFFWVVSVFLGWNLAQGIADQSRGELSVGLALILWILAVLLSLLVHEFGHVLAFRFFGVDSDVVLYQMGGLAIPRRSFGFESGRQPWQEPTKQIVISAAGPLAQLLMAVIVAGIFYVGGFLVPNPLPFIHSLDFLFRDGRWPPLALYTFEVSLILSSVWWALLNLLPIYPLDGGQISREMFTLASPQQGIRFSLILSVAVAAAVAVWGFTHDDTFMGIMFALLAYSSFKTLQAYFGGGRRFGGGM